MLRFLRKKKARPSLRHIKQDGSWREWHIIPCEACGAHFPVRSGAVVATCHNCHEELDIIMEERDDEDGGGAA